MRDGLVGFWNGAPSVGAAPTLGTAEDADIDYLTADIRADLLDSVLAARFGFAGSAAPTAHLTVDGAASIQLTRPAPEFFRRQLVFLRSYADLRTDRMVEIDVQMQDMLSFFGLVGMLNDSRRRYTLELMAAVIRLAVHVEMPLKHFCRAARPMDYSDRVMPLIQTPSHSSFPSGHAMEAFAAATVQDRLCRGRAYAPEGLHALPYRIAHRIAVNRTVAGVHFPVDSLIGALIGCRLGEDLDRLAHGLAPLPAIALDLGPDDRTLLCGRVPISADEDFTLELLGRLHQPGPDHGAAPCGILGRLWAKAAAEWPETAGPET